MSELIREADKAIVCPRANSTASAIVIDLKRIVEAEARIIEVQAFTPTKAGELCTAFTISWRDLHHNICALEAEKIAAQKVVDRRTAVITLEEMPKILKEKGVASNKETREAVLALDVELQAAQDVVDQITAIIELLKGKQKAFEWAFTTVKKIMGTSEAYNYLGGADTVTNLDGSRPESSPDSARSRMGKPRY